MGSQYESPAQTFRRGLRLSEAAARGVRNNYPVLHELVEHAEEDLDKFDQLHQNQPTDIAEALEAAQAAVHGLMVVLEKHQPTPEQ